MLRRLMATVRALAPARLLHTDPDPVRGTLRRFHGRVGRVLPGARVPQRPASAACVRLARSPDGRSPDSSLLHADRAAGTTLTTPRSDARATQLHYGPPTNNEEMVANLTRHGSIWSPDVIAAFSQVDRGKLRALGSAQSVSATLAPPRLLLAAATLRPRLTSSRRPTRALRTLH